MIMLNTPVLTEHPLNRVMEDIFKFLEEKFTYSTHNRSKLFCIIFPKFAQTFITKFCGEKEAFRM